MDDSPGLFFEEGALNASTTANHSAPIQIRADFVDDGDWIRISARDPYFDNSVIVYLPEDGLEPISGDYQWAVFDKDFNQLDGGQQEFRVPLSIPQFSGARYLKITADAKTEIDQDTGDTIVTPTYYRVGIGQQGDVAGDTIADARPYNSNFRGTLASSISDQDDVDFFSVELTSGDEYEFTLFSNGIESAWLRQAVLELHDENGLVVAGESPSISRKDIRYTPTETKTYYLKVATDAAELSYGGYFVRSPQFDADLWAGSTITRGVVAPGQTVTSSVDFEGDVDWARLSTRRFFSYEVKTARRDDIRIVNESGRELSGSTFSEFEDLVSRYVEFSGDTPGEFRFEEVDKDEDLDLAKASFAGGEGFYGAIETPEDVDLFRSFLIPFVDYQVSVEETVAGQWSGNLVVEALNDDGSVSKTFNVTESESTFDFDIGDGIPTRNVPGLGLRREQHFRVRANNGEVTGYRLAFTAKNEDEVGSRLSTAEPLPLVGGIARARSVLQGPADWDVYQVELRANVWYELSADILPSGQVSLFRAGESGSEEIFGSFLGGQNYYRLNESGTYYLAAGRSVERSSNGVAGFEFTFKENAVPDPTVKYRSSLATQLNPQYSSRRLPTEVWSEVPLIAEESNLQIPAGTVATLTTEQWQSLRSSVAGATGRVFYRNIAGDGRRLPWEMFSLYDAKRIPEFEGINLTSVRYVFSESFPQNLSTEYDYLEDSFEPLTDRQKGYMNVAINRWRDLSNRISLGGGQSNMQIYQADLGADEDLLSFAPGGGGIGSDIILNTSSTLFDDVDSSDEATFQLIQAIGKAMGAPLLDSVDRFESVMGTKPPETNSDAYPTSLMPADLRLTDFTNFSFSERTSDRYQFSQSGGLPESILARPSTRIEISAEGISHRASINLNRGQSSSTLAGSDRLQSFHMGLGTDGYNATGGSANDGLTGNHLANVLVGGGGNDVIKGGPGNDRLYGDNENGDAVAGNDYYIIGVASGNDFIDETAGGGTDVIRWEGMYDYDSIEQDFTFRRFGNDLLIRLELNGQRNNNGEQIRIRNMGTENSRIEALALLNTNGFVDRISLQSVWDQATESRQRFKVVAGNDGFGSLVSPD